MLVDDSAIACSLTDGELDGRIEEWQRLAGSATERMTIEAGVQLTFAAIDRRALADLIEREHECCPFLSFTTRLTPTGTALEITGPADAAELLAALA